MAVRVADRAGTRTPRAATHVLREADDPDLVYDEPLGRDPERGADQHTDGADSGAPGRRQARSVPGPPGW